MFLVLKISKICIFRPLPPSTSAYVIYEWSLRLDLGRVQIGFMQIDIEDLLPLLTLLESSLITFDKLDNLEHDLNLRWNLCWNLRWAWGGDLDMGLESWVLTGI